MAKPDLMERVVNLCKRRGLVFPSSEIYGGFRSTWDYGPLGVLLTRTGVREGDRLGGPRRWEVGVLSLCVVVGVDDWIRYGVAGCGGRDGAVLEGSMRVR